MTSDLSTSPSHDEALDTFEFPPSADVQKKTRRQTAFYPNMKTGNKPQKPFSRSAAKRESVMALGSIEHLQHYFTKTGIAAKENPLKQSSGLVPAIGGPAGAPHVPALDTVQEFHLPPSPAVPVFPRPPFPHVEKTYETDAENLKPGVISDLKSVATVWGLYDEHGKNRTSDEIDILTTLKQTTHLIRSVRNYLVSLPDDSSPIPPGPKPQFRPSTLKPAPIRRVVSNPGSDDPLSRIRRSALDVLTVLRALEESTRLPLSDDAYDAQSDHASTQSSETNSGSHPSVSTVSTVSPASSRVRSQSPQLFDEPESLKDTSFNHDVSFAVSLVNIPGRRDGVPVWIDEDEQFDNEDEIVKREVWDDRLVLGGGWLYRQDIKLSELTHEREIVTSYVDAVDEVLFGGSNTSGKRGWERAEEEERSKQEKEGRSKGRRSSLGDKSVEKKDRFNVLSAGSLGVSPDLSEKGDGGVLHEIEEEDVEDEDLPDWAKRSSFPNDSLARAHALIVALLPPSTSHLMSPDYPGRLPFLESLSTGQALCLAYNAGVRRSRKPWGYVDKDSVHDIAALAAEAAREEAITGQDAVSAAAAAERRKNGWTFRRTDNLRLWAAALKLRYMIPLTTPPTPVNVAAAPPIIHEPVSRSGTPIPLSPSKSASSRRTASPAPGTISPAGRPDASPGRSTGKANAEPVIVFDAKLVARRDDGWDFMLERSVLLWVDAVVAEKRGDH